MFAYFRLVRIVNLFILALSLYLFYYYIIVPVHKNILFNELVPFIKTDFFLFVLATVLIAAAGNIINDYFDIEVDKFNRPERPLPSAKVSLNTALILHSVFALTGIAIGFYLSWQAGHYQIGFLFLISSVLLYVYSAFLKRVPIVGNLLVAALTAFPFIVLLVFEASFLSIVQFENKRFAFDAIVWQVYFYGGFAFFTNLVREMIKDLEDRAGDEENRVTTFAVQFGEKPAKYLTAFVIVLLLAMLSFFFSRFIIAQHWKEVIYLNVLVLLPLVSVLILVLVANKKEQFSRLSLAVKVIMLLGILSMPAFHWFNQ